MLCLLHTADWHLGHQLHGVDRLHEHRCFLDWLLEILETEQVDALIIAGDVFDSANLPVAAQALFYGFLASARRRCPQLDMVIIAGNHDFPARLEAPEPLSRGINARVVGLAQWLGREHLRYSGSPLPLALDERRYNHQIVLADLDGPRCAGIRTLPVPRSVAIHCIPDSGPAPLDEVLVRLKALELAPVDPEPAPPRSASPTPRTTTASRAASVAPSSADTRGDDDTFGGHRGRATRDDSLIFHRQLNAPATFAEPRW